MTSVVVNNFIHNGAATPQSITGLGFTPSAVILISCSVTSLGSTGSARQMIGAASASTNQWTANTRSQEPVGTSNTARSLRSGFVYSVVSLTTDTDDAGVPLTSLDADGFTFTNDGTAARTAYAAFGQGVLAKAGTFDMNAALGSQSIICGFQPKIVMFWSTIDSTTEGVTAGGAMMMGAASSATQRWAGANIDGDNLGTTDNARYLTTAKCIVKISTSAVTAAADFVSNDPTGFTINITTAPAAATRIGYLALGGASLQAYAGTVTQKTTAGTLAMTGVGFQPNFAMFGMLCDTVDTIEAHAYSLMGFASGTANRAVVAVGNADNVGTSDSAREFLINACIDIVPANAGASTVLADLSSFDADGLTLNWTVTDGTARKYGLVALSVPEGSITVSSGDTLCWFTPQMNEAPQTNYATLDLRNGHLVLDFDDTTQETAIFSAIMPRAYSGNGVTVYIHWGATTAIVGTGGWDVSFERVSDSVQDIDSDGFATAQTVTAATVPGTSGLFKITSVSISNGANMDSVVAGDGFRIRIRRDVANDTAVGDLELWGIEIKEQ